MIQVKEQEHEQEEQEQEEQQEQEERTVVVGHAVFSFWVQYVGGASDTCTHPPHDTRHTHARMNDMYEYICMLDGGGGVG